MYYFLGNGQSKDKYRLRKIFYLSLLGRSRLEKQYACIKFQMYMIFECFQGCIVLKRYFEVSRRCQTTLIILRTSLEHQNCNKSRIFEKQKIWGGKIWLGGVKLAYPPRFERHAPGGGDNLFQLRIGVFLRGVLPENYPDVSYPLAG